MNHIIWIDFSNNFFPNGTYERTILNFVMVTVVILWLDEMVKDKRLFCLHVVLKNIH